MSSEFQLVASTPLAKGLRRKVITAAKATGVLRLPLFRTHERPLARKIAERRSEVLASVPPAQIIAFASPKP